MILNITIGCEKKSTKEKKYLWAVEIINEEIIGVGCGKKSTTEKQYLITVESINEEIVGKTWTVQNNLENETKKIISNS